jgi:nucleotide-binding universal stress UspA family protein
MAGLKEALKLAKNQHAKLRLLHVVDQTIVFSTPEGGMNIGPMLEDMKRSGKRLLQKAEKFLWRTASSRNQICGKARAHA